MSENTEHAKSQAEAQLSAIVDMVKALRKADENTEAEYDGTAYDEDGIRQVIKESPLSVMVRSGWRMVGNEAEDEEFEILLCTGGPAVRIVGQLARYHEPENAHIEYQDWGTPWTRYTDTTAEQDEAILEYCRCFYFGD